MKHIVSISFLIRMALTLCVPKKESISSYADLFAYFSKPKSVLNLTFGLRIAKSFKS